MLSEAAPLPLPVDDHDRRPATTCGCSYRYLDLRRSGPANALRLRCRANQIAREVLHARDFLEIETPTLTRSTPEGARDFLVPVRLQPGTWYALPQSPQLFKQLLMVGRHGAVLPDRPLLPRRGLPRRPAAGVHPARHRDVLRHPGRRHRARRGDRRRRSGASWPAYEIAAPIPRITWHDAMARYGSDKPDLRYGVELTELTDYLRGTEFRVFAGAIDAGGYVGAVVMPGGAAQTRKELDGWQDWAKARGARGLAYVVLDAETGEARGPVAKNLSEEHLAGLADAVGAKPGDAVFFAAATDRREAQELLGAARIEIAKRAGLIDETAWAFCWVVDAPMFERHATRAAGRPCTTRSPRRTPSGSTGSRRRPDQALAYAYDIVCNGNEIGGGSIRIHRGDVQQRVFDLLGITPGGGAGQVRLPAGGVQVRPAAARRHRVRLGPDLHAARRRRLDPRGHRVPEDPAAASTR